MPLNMVIPPRSTSLYSAIKAKIDQKTKPLGSLGQLEHLAMQIALCQNTLTPCLQQPCLMVFAGDHGIAAEGVSAYPATVTAQMVNNFISGGAAINVFARQHNLELIIVDAGVQSDLAAHPSLINAKIAYGTQNFLQQAAMTAEQCQQALQHGADLVLRQYASGCNCVGFGEMGIGNSSSAALLMHCITGHPLADCVGRGTGLNDTQLLNKLSILQQARAKYPHVYHPLDILSTFGGFEIAMQVGAMAKAASLGMLLMIDGFITSSALLIAHQLQPHILDYCVFSHVANERGHRALLQFLNVKPVLQLDLRLGEGSGVALAFPLVQSAVLFLNEMASFSEAGVDG